MQVIVNHQNLTPSLAGFDSVRIEGQLSDPVGKAHFQLDDTGSAIALVVGQEVIIVDETIPLQRITGVTNVPTPFSDSFATNDIANYTSTSNSGGSNATWTITTGGGGGTTALSLYLTTAASATLGTANQLYTISGTPTSIAINTTCNSSTGWGELPAVGSTAAWPTLGAIGAPSGKGFFLDTTVLNGQTITGNWSGQERINQNSGTGTVTTDIVVRAYKYSSGVYTNIVTMTLAGQALTTAFASVALPSTAGTSTSFATGDKLYIDYWCNITNNTSAVGQQIVQNRQSQDTVGKTGDPLNTVTTPGYQATTSAGLTASGGAKALLLVNNWTALSSTVSCTVTTSDLGGLAWNVVDTNNFYELAVGDATSPSANTLQLYKTVAGTRTTIGSSASISFTRTTSHTVLVTSSSNSAGTSTTIVVFFDGVQKISYTDSSPLGRGQAGLRNDVSGGHSSAIYTAFSATSNDAPFVTTTDLSIPTHNYLINNNFNFGSSNWVTFGTAGMTFPSNPTYGTTAKCTLTYANTAVGNATAYQNIAFAYGIPGQQYCFSGSLNITTTFTNASFYIQINFSNAAGTQLASFTQTYTANTSGVTRVSIIATAPATTAFVQANFGGHTTNATNAGVATFTALQLETAWFTATPAPNVTAGYVVSYPTPICDFLQPDCATVLDGTAVRFNRIFAGFISNLKAGYNGPNRLWMVECTSLAGYLETDLLINSTYTNTLDQQIIYNAIGATTHLIAQTPASVHGNGPDFASANKVAVIAGQTIAATTYNDATPREVLNDLQNYSSYIFGADSYNNVFYTPRYFNKAPYGFSTSPDNSTTFPMYDYLLEIDGTQIHNCINVSGGTYQPSITESFHANDGSRSQFINGSSQMVNFATTYQGVTIPALVVNGSTLVVGGGGALYSQGYTAIYTDGISLMALLNPAPSGQTVVCTYTYDALVYVQVLDIGSIQQYGQRWGKINDNALGTLAAAQARGEAELAQYAQPRLVLKFKTQKLLIPGQVVQVTNAYDNLNSTNFTVQKVNVSWLGNGINVYDIECGAYQPDLTDYMRNIHKAITRGKNNANAIIQSFITANEGDSITFSDSINIH